MRILAIDPGDKESAWLEFEPDLTGNGPGRPLKFGFVPNDELLTKISDDFGEHNPCDHLVIEGIASYGMAVGREVFDTCIWIGRYLQHWERNCCQRNTSSLLYRPDIKLHLCYSRRAKDPNVRQALLDRWGGKSAVGLKATPGPLYGISSHAWSALAVAVTRADQLRAEMQASAKLSPATPSPTPKTVVQGAFL